MQNVKTFPIHHIVKILHKNTGVNYAITNHITINIITCTAPKFIITITISFHSCTDTLSSWHRCGQDSTRTMNEGERHKTAETISVTGTLYLLFKGSVSSCSSLPGICYLRTTTYIYKGNTTKASFWNIL